MRESRKFRAGMIGKFFSERREKTKQDLVFTVVNCDRIMDDLPSCLTLRNIESKKDQEDRKTGTTSEERFARNALPREVISPVLWPRLSKNKKDFRPEIQIEGTALNYQSAPLAADDKDVKEPCLISSREEQSDGLRQDESPADGSAEKSEERSLRGTPESMNSSGEVQSQDIDLNILESRRSLNPSPWKEIWSVLHDKRLGNCLLSTKSVEFARDISATPSSTRTIPHIKTRREKPQRVPPLYNLRKNVPTTKEKAKVPSFDDTFTAFKTFCKGGQDTGVAFDSCPEDFKLKDLKDHGVQSEGVQHGGRTCKTHECKGTKAEIVGLPNIACPPSDRYKSKFRVRLLPLVTKSDSLPNLISKSTSVPSELIVTAPIQNARSSENISVDLARNAERRNDFVEENHSTNVCRQNRSMSLDSVFSLESFQAYHAGKSAGGKINVQGFKVLPEIKRTSPKKYQQTLKQSDKEVPNISRQSTVITLPWKCN